jgi:hypothetical protein
MKAGALAIGVFLMAIGIVVFWIGYSDLQQYGGLLFMAADGALRRSSV